MLKAGKHAETNSAGITKSAPPRSDFRVCCVILFFYLFSFWGNKINAKLGENVLRLKYAPFWDFIQRTIVVFTATSGQPFGRIFDCTTLEEATDRISRNVDKKLLFYDM
jgi:hypothetical protein